MSLLMSAAELGYLPYPIVRFGIRKLLKERIGEIAANHQFHRSTIVDQLKSSIVAIETDKANEQHYEVPADFFKLVLGKNLKYSSALFENGAQDLSEAEDQMLRLYAERAQIKNGMHILELGCGWGSLCLWLAKQFPDSTITSVSNSKSQKTFIDSKAQAAGIRNLNVITCDINTFGIENRFDRIVSIEMFEHLRNYEIIFDKMSRWLKPNGKAFIHIFCHKDSSYFFETEGDHNWMGKYFFTGGIMPAFDLFEKAQSSFDIETKWAVNGKNYERTSNEWLKNMETHRREIITIFAQTYGESQALIWFNRWKMFFAACAELFGYSNGEEWFVGHYLMVPKVRK